MSFQQNASSSTAQIKWHQQDTQLQATKTIMHSRNWQEVWIKFLAQCHKEWLSGLWSQQKAKSVSTETPLSTFTSPPESVVNPCEHPEGFFSVFSPLPVKGGLCHLIWGWTRFLNWSRLFTFFLFAPSNVFVVISPKLSPDKWQYNILQRERLAGPSPVVFKLHHAKQSEISWKKFAQIERDGCKECVQFCGGLSSEFCRGFVIQKGAFWRAWVKTQPC